MGINKKKKNMDKNEIINILSVDKIVSAFRTSTGNWANELNNLDENDEYILCVFAQACSGTPIGNNSKETRDLVNQNLDKKKSNNKK